MKDNITLEKLKKTNLLIIGGPRGYFTGEEIDILQNYLEEGGNILVLLGEGGEEKYFLNLFIGMAQILIFSLKGME